MDKVFCLIFVIMGGIALAIQSPVNAGLGKRVGSLAGGLLSFIGGVLVLLVLVLVFGKGNLMAFTQVPKWQLIGGFLGVIAVMSVIVATPHLGVGVVLVVILLGQVVMGVVIDHFGLFRSPVVPLSPLRIGGVIFIIIGVVMVFKSKIGG
ncbi:MAG: DMT family transporter [Clostridiales bacterium]